MGTDSDQDWMTLEIKADDLPFSVETVVSKLNQWTDRADHHALYVTVNAIEKLPIRVATTLLRCGNTTIYEGVAHQLPRLMQSKRIDILLAMLDGIHSGHRDYWLRQLSEPVDVRTVDYSVFVAFANVVVSLCPLEPISDLTWKKFQLDAVFNKNTYAQHWFPELRLRL